MLIFNIDISGNYCVINNKVVKYDACSQRSLDKAKAFYKTYRNGIFDNYIGSGKRMYVDGVEQENDKVYHSYI